MGISLIVPARNAARYEKIFLLSVQKQMHGDFEAIVVVDPSDDATLEIARSFETADKRFRVIENKKRMGLSYSRYIGLAASSKSHVLFADCDDYMSLDLFSFAEKAIGDADCLVYGYYDYKGGKNYPGKYGLEGTFDGYGALRKLFAEYELRPVLWNKLFRKDVLRGDLLVLPPGIFPPSGESFLFLLAPLLRCRKVVATKEMYYHYRHSQYGLSRGKEHRNRAYGRLLCEEYAASYLRERSPEGLRALMDAIGRYELTMESDFARDRRAGLNPYKLYRSKVRAEFRRFVKKGPFGPKSLFGERGLEDVLVEVSF